MSRVVVLPALEAAGYRRHALHADERVWVEKNCYIDICIEVVHALGLEPLAMLPFVAAIDFEGDQWTFFKPPHDELRELYGLDFQELNVWRPLADHAQEHLAGGKLISTEADAFYLPDTAGTDYQRQHTKTTIVIQDFDLERRRLGYFHNAGYYALEGDDFAHLFRVGVAPDPTFMPLYAEVVRIDRLARRAPDELRALSRALLGKHVARRPGDNPVARFGQRFAADLPWITSEGLAFYHAWAFATVRQLGAAFELAALHLEWLGDRALAPATLAFSALSQTAKAFILKAARAVNAKRALDARPMFDEMAAAWQAGMDTLTARLP
ncbi:MAG TPA: DUF1839 family protein [Polyangia bacterium]|jgi:hypothetical protein|nr:DUF1839 family protein [Polyangia bacterium]